MAWKRASGRGLKGEEILEPPAGGDRRQHPAGPKKPDLHVSFRDSDLLSYLRDGTPVTVSQPEDLAVDGGKILHEAPQAFSLLLDMIPVLLEDQGFITGRSDIGRLPVLLLARG